MNPSNEYILGKRMITAWHTDIPTRIKELPPPQASNSSINSIIPCLEKYESLKVLHLKIQLQLLWLLLNSPSFWEKMSGRNRKNEEKKRTHTHNCLSSYLFSYLVKDFSKCESNGSILILSHSSLPWSHTSRHFILNLKSDHSRKSLFTISPFLPFSLKRGRVKVRSLSHFHPIKCVIITVSNTSVKSVSLSHSCGRIFSSIILCDSTSSFFPSPLSLSF